MKTKEYQLAELIEVTRGTSLKGEYYSTSGKYKRMTLGNFDYNNNAFKEDKQKDNIYYIGNFDEKFILNEGDIVTPLTEQAIGLLGSTAFIPQSDIYIHSQDIGLIIPNKNIDKNFCYYLISSDFVKKQISSMAQQTKIRHTSPNKIKQCKVIIPNDLKYQKRVGEILRKIDIKIDLNNNMILKLESMMKDIYDYWFVQFDFPNNKGKPYKSSGGKMVYNEKLKREVPEIFKIEKLCDITNIYQPKTISEKDLDKNGQYFVYGANGIIGKYNKYNHECNEVAVCCRGASCGNLLMTLPYSWITGNSMVISPIGNLNLKEYVYYYLVKYGLKKYVTGSAQPQITRANIEKMDIVLPNNDLLNTFNVIVLTIRKKSIKLILENNMLKEYKNFILPLLMNGQVEVK